MAQRGWLSKVDADTAQTERLSFSHDPSTLIAPHFVERVLASVESDHPRRIETTLDATLQRTVAGIIAAHRKALDDHHARTSPSSCSTTAPANGSRGKDPATTSIRTTAAPSTA
jgi:membrane carboxypeptidase/penicillin-binding protein PbpC